MSVSEHSESNSSNFKIILEQTNYPILERYCQLVSLPSITINKTLTSTGYNTIKHPGDKIEFDSLKVEVLLDRDILSYLEVYNLFIETINPDTGEIVPKKSIFDTKIVILDNSRQPLYEFKYIDSFISSLDGLTFDHRKTEFLTFGVEIFFTGISITNLQRN